MTEQETISTEKHTGKMIRCACCGKFFKGIDLYDAHLKYLEEDKDDEFHRPDGSEVEIA